MYCFICFIVVLITVANNCIFGVHHPSPLPLSSVIYSCVSLPHARALICIIHRFHTKNFIALRLGTHISLQRNKAVCMVLVVKHTCYSRNCHHGNYHHGNYHHRYYTYRNYHHGDYLHRNYNYQ